jgi:hypothetical protein
MQGLNPVLTLMSNSFPLLFCAMLDLHTQDPPLNLSLADLACIRADECLHIHLPGYTNFLFPSSHRSSITMSGQFVEIGGIRVDISQFDLSDTSSRVNDVRTANIVLISLVIVTVSLRLLARIKFVKRVFADDGKGMQRAVVQAC